MVKGNESHLSFVGRMPTSLIYGFIVVMFISSETWQLIVLDSSCLSDSFRERGGYLVPRTGGFYHFNQFRSNDMKNS